MKLLRVVCCRCKVMLDLMYVIGMLFRLDGGKMNPRFLIIKGVNLNLMLKCQGW